MSYRNEGMSELPQSSAILAKVGRKNLQFAKVDRGALQLGGKKSAPTAEISRQAAHCSPLWQFAEVDFGN
jgi:hypothetical protein